MGFRGQPGTGWVECDWGKHGLKLVVFLSDSMLQFSVLVVVLIQLLACLLYIPDHWTYIKKKQHNTPSPTLPLAFFFFLVILNWDRFKYLIYNMALPVVFSWCCGLVHWSVGTYTCSGSCSLGKTLHTALLCDKRAILLMNKKRAWGIAEGKITNNGIFTKLCPGIFFPLKNFGRYNWHKDQNPGQDPF